MAYQEHLPPDVGAAKLWLTNRHPGRWRERCEVGVTGTLEHRLAQMTPQERRARLLELQARAAAVIEGEATEGEPKGDLLDRGTGRKPPRGGDTGGRGP